MERCYCWRRQEADHRDWPLMIAPTALPSSVDLRPQMPPVYDQGQLGSCTANAGCGAYRYEAMRQGESFEPSRLDLYYRTRALEGTTKEDSGATIRDTLKALSKGVCSEAEWPYVAKNYAHAPPKAAKAEEAQHKALSYFAVQQNATVLKTCLSQRYPIEFGIDVYESFESDAVAKSGVVPMPKARERSLGGHALLLVGYDDSEGAFLVRNSWGSDWGVAGYCWLPHDYVLSSRLASDFWTLRQVS